MDHTTHARLNGDELTDAVLSGATIYGPENETIGHVAHVHGAGPTAEVIIDFGGFLGIGSKHVAVPVRDLDFMRDENANVHAVTNWTKDQLHEMPEHHH